jgi:hypothetical protein
MVHIDDNNFIEKQRKCLLTVKSKGTANSKMNLIEGVIIRPCRRFGQY